MNGGGVQAEWRSCRTIYSVRVLKENVHLLNVTHSRGSMLSMFWPKFPDLCPHWVTDRRTSFQLTLFSPLWCLGSCPSRPTLNPPLVTHYVNMICQSCIHSPSIFPAWLCTDKKTHTSALFLSVFDHCIQQYRHNLLFLAKTLYSDAGAAEPRGRGQRSQKTESLVENKWNISANTQYQNVHYDTAFNQTRKRQEIRIYEKNNY